MKFSHILLTVLLTAFCAGPSAALRCYVCTSKRDARCADPVAGGRNATPGGELRPQECLPGGGGTAARSALEAVGHLLTVVGQSPQLPAPPQRDQPAAPAAPAACQKIVLTVLGETVTGRGCTRAAGPSFSPCDAVKLTASSDVVVRYCGACGADACNAAPRRLPAAAAPGALLLAALRRLR